MTRRALKARREKSKKPKTDFLHHPTIFTCLLSVFGKSADFAIQNLLKSPYAYCRVEIDTIVAAISRITRVEVPAISEICSTRNTRPHVGASCSQVLF